MDDQLSTCDVAKLLGVSRATAARHAEAAGAVKVGRAYVWPAPAVELLAERWGRVADLESADPRFREGAAL